MSPFCIGSGRGNVYVGFVMVLGILELFVGLVYGMIIFSNRSSELACILTKQNSFVTIYDHVTVYDHKKKQQETICSTTKIQLD